jgi:hypothetical protein
LSPIQYLQCRCKEKLWFVSKPGDEGEFHTLSKKCLAFLEIKKQIFPG